MKVFTPFSTFHVAAAAPHNPGFQTLVRMDREHTRGKPGKSDGLAIGTMWGCGRESSVGDATAHSARLTPSRCFVCDAFRAVADGLQLQPEHEALCGALARLLPRLSASELLA